MLNKICYSELNARQRAFALLDSKSSLEILDIFTDNRSPHLLNQNIVAQNDDGVIIAKGKRDGVDTVICSIEGQFQGGAIGEISGAKLSSAMEYTLKLNENGKKTNFFMILDTGGVRLQEANYGLLAISEIQDMVIRLRKHVPVIGIIPGKIGCFGGMSMTASLFSYLIMTKVSRLTLNGFEVIEQEAGRAEFDSSDRELIWKTTGGISRVEQGIADYLAEDDLTDIQSHIDVCLKKIPDQHRSENFIKNSQNLTFYPDKMRSFDQPTNNGTLWFNNLCGHNKQLSKVSSILCCDAIINDEEIRVVTTSPSEKPKFPRTGEGEFGLEEGYEIARLINSLIMKEENSEKKTPILCIVDCPSQAYGYEEEKQGIFLSCASSVDAYASARHAGHPVITLIVGKAISGAFLAHGLQASYMIALDTDDVKVHAMSEGSAARITKRSKKDLEDSAKKVPGIAYDIKSYYKLGAVNSLININAIADKDKQIEVVKKSISLGIKESLKNGNRLNYRLTTENSDGRILTKRIRGEILNEGL